MPEPDEAAAPAQGGSEPAKTGLAPAQTGPELARAVLDAAKVRREAARAARPRVPAEAPRRRLRGYSGPGPDPRDPQPLGAVLDRLVKARG